MLVMLEAVPKPRTVKSAKTLMPGISVVSEDSDTASEDADARHTSGDKQRTSGRSGGPLQDVFPYILSFTCTPTRTILPVKTLMLGGGPAAGRSSGPSYLRYLACHVRGYTDSITTEDTDADSITTEDTDADSITTEDTDADSITTEDTDARRVGPMPSISVNRIVNRTDSIN
jgi:hypothetical protein